ncbi:WRKY transcription factor 72A-like isoform X2 [Spinacia oleracea]|uniref:WRKY transcription factor 72A-like isoform X2 n=1 Tax=Spinacia oleracea TaxID=3562 RepID=A0A9R0JS69_SPIOL|nr:WRKY transcription factor 72A-like isoform X2 [Spinacia oleracea]
MMNSCFLPTSKRSKMEAELSGSSICNNDQDQLLKSAKAKMGEVKEENQKLKRLLSQILKEYQSLEKQITSMGQPKQSTTETNSSSNNEDDYGVKDQDQPEMVSLTLGSWNNPCNKKQNYDKKQESDDSLNKTRKVETGGLELGLDYRNPRVSTTDSIKYSSLENSNKVLKEDENVDTWTSTQDLKVKENTNSREVDDQEILHQPQVKKTRVCIRSRCDSPTIHDGCHWRKYGQKIAKGNPCPRAYYRCTVSPNCPVRKQVQRCPHDMSILITTYEGTHNHPLPLSATAMASATSAAASMIKSSTLTSQTPTLTRPGLTTSSLGLHSSNFMTTFNNNPSLISASCHNSHPTVTLDLTVPNSGFSSFDWLSSSSSYSSATSSRNSSFLNFSSSAASSSLPSLDFSTSSLPTSSSWASGYLLPYTNHHNNNTRTNNIYQNPSNNNNNVQQQQQQQSLNETIAAVATKAIASNPNFQSVLAAAISSYVGNKANNDQKMTSFPSSGALQSAESSRSLALFPTSLPALSTSKNNASVAADARDNVG